MYLFLNSFRFGVNITTQQAGQQVLHLSAIKINSKI